MDVCFLVYNLAGEAIANMVIGGTASVITGGKFSNGARTAAYQLLFNGWGAKVAKAAARNFWTITPVGASKVMKHSKFGKFYKSESDGLWWSIDKAGHGDSKWKVFTENKGGLEWLSDADDYGNFIVGKHKGPTGMSISWKELNSVSGWDKAINTSIVVGITALEIIDPTTYIMSPPMDPHDQLPSSN